MSPVDAIRWRKRTAVAVLAGAGTGAALVALNSLQLGAVGNALVVIACTVIVAGLSWLSSDLYPGARPAYWLADLEPPHQPRRGDDFRMHRLRRDLRYTLEDPHEADAIRPLLVSLVRQRLRDRHGIQLTEEPERAREVLDPVLVEYLAEAPTGRRRRSRSHLSTVLDRIEEL